MVKQDLALPSVWEHADRTSKGRVLEYYCPPPWLLRAMFHQRAWVLLVP